MKNNFLDGCLEILCHGRSNIHHIYNLVRNKLRSRLGLPVVPTASSMRGCLDLTVSVHILSALLASPPS